MKRLILFGVILSFVATFMPVRTRSEEPSVRYLIGTLFIKDTAKWGTVYAHVIFDPVKDRKKTQFEFLAIGDKIRHYGGYGNYQMDSLSRAKPELVGNVSLEEYSAIRKDAEPLSDNLLFDTQDSIVTYHGKIFINHYRYFEPVPKFEWKLEDETMTVLGYECHKATTRWRGRDWIAWYADIPLSAGPWKFHGLPGLILQLEDSNKEHYFEAIDFVEETFPVGYRKKLYCKTTREKFNSELDEFMNNAGDVMLSSGMMKVIDGDEKRMRKVRLFFNPIELE